MAHSTFSRKSLGMAVAIAVGITAAPAVSATGPLAAVTPVAQAQDTEKDHIRLPDSAVRSVAVESIALGKVANDSVTISNGGSDDRDARSMYKISVNMLVPKSESYQEYDITLENLSSIHNIKEAGPGTSGVETNRYFDEGTATAHFVFSPENKDRNFTYTIYADNTYTNGHDVTAKVIGGNTTFHSWTMNVPNPNKPKPEPKPSSTAQPAPSGNITNITVDDNGNYTITVTGVKKY